MITTTVISCKKFHEIEPTPAPTPAPVVVDSLKVGLIAYYTFDNTGVDSSGIHNDVSFYHNTTSTSNRFGQANRAFYFDGTTSYLIVKDSPSLRLSNTDFTINTWINLDNYNTSFGAEVLVKRNQGNAQGWNYGVTGQANFITNGYPIGVSSYNVSGGGDPLAIGTKAIGLNQWRMLTTVYNFQKKQIAYYIDGVLDNVTNNIPSPNSSVTADMYIGQDSQTTINTAYFLKGKLDDVRIYSRALSISDIYKLFVKTN